MSLGWRCILNRYYLIIWILGMEPEFNDNKIYFIEKWFYLLINSVNINQKNTKSINRLYI